MTTPLHTCGDGPGLKIKGKPSEKWYGPGYCGICGDTGDDLVPQSVRWWDCDDGWRYGVLCVGCGEDAHDHGPKPDDYAVVTANPDELSADDRIDILHSMGDEDATYSDMMD